MSATTYAVPDVFRWSDPSAAAPPADLERAAAAVFAITGCPLEMVAVAPDVYAMLAAWMRRTFDLSGPAAEKLTYSVIGPCPVKISRSLPAGWLVLYGSGPFQEWLVDVV